MTDDHQPGGRRGDSRRPVSRQGEGPRPEGHPGRSLPAGGPLSAEEQAVRELMRRSVAGLEPDHGSLGRIRSGVPRRRAIRRNAWTGAAAVALATAVVLPALRYPDRLGLAGPAAASTADGAQTAPDATPPVGSGTSGHPSFPYSWGGPARGPGGGPSSSSPAASGGAGAASGGASAGPGAGAPVPACTAADLGPGPSYVGVPDAAGALYGSFTVVNVSAHSCAPPGPGILVVSAATGSSPAQVRVVDHLAGDAATALPDPVALAAAGPAVLAPQAAYRIGFGWVPGAPCQKSAPATVDPAAAVPAAQDSPGPAAAAASAGPGVAGDPSPSAAPQTSAPSPTASPSSAPSAPVAGITLAYTPAPAGSATETAVLPGACAGTVYRTAPQPAPSPGASTATGG
ncbi:hypothetical protein [Kitasatospora sp. NBC_00315]|uniref:hypothetical protein n=1 Tax=Kitasatospora sp. NBC_00315 TaxID=2975963 RepID=UPI00324832F6